MNKELFEALDLLEKERHIPKSYMLEKIEAALTAACKKELGTTNITVVLDPEKMDMKVYRKYLIVAEVEDPNTEITKEGIDALEQRYHEEGLKLKTRSRKRSIGSDYEYELQPKEFGRLSAQNAKQVIIQGIREAERSQDNEDDVRNEWDGLFKSSPYESRHPWISDSRRCPSTISDCPESTIVYVPFDTCPFKLGGTLLAQSKGHNGGPGAQIMDPDYFIDCYEVVRELIEDGVVIAGISVGDGGLATAAARMCRKNGAGLDISRLMASYGENDSTKVLFGETPGVLVQIKDCDFDYFDSQMILQDIAYYPLGSPDKAAEGVKFIDNHQNGVADILAALMNQASEGEDQENWRKIRKFAPDFCYAQNSRKNYIQNKNILRDYGK